MARYIAIDWDSVEARYVIADVRRDQTSVEAAGTVAMPSDASSAALRSQLGELLKSELAGKASRAKTLVSIDRSQVEVLTLTLPPATDADLPELVRNQAMRDNTAISEDALLDFLPLGDDASQPRKVAAASLAPSRREQIDAILSGAGLNAECIALRPYATANLVLANLTDRNETCLVVHALAEEVDLVILSGGLPVFWRTLRLAHAARDLPAAQKLLGEIKRTVLLAQPHFPGRTLQSVYLCGGLQEHPALFDVLSSGAGTPVSLLDPFAKSELPQPVEHPGRFAPLLGLLLAAGTNQAPFIDFVHPRRKPEPPDRRRLYALAGSALAIVLLLGVYQAWTQFSAADESISDLTSELERLNDQFKQAGQRQKVITALENWSKNEVNWLDELRDLSLRFPGGRDAVVLRMGLSQGRDGGGVIDLVGIVRDPVVVTRFENNLRDVHHQISSRHVQEQNQKNDYTWHFESTVGIVPRKADQYVSHLPPPAADAATGPGQANGPVQANQPGQTAGQLPAGAGPKSKRPEAP